MKIRSFHKGAADEFMLITSCFLKHRPLLLRPPIAYIVLFSVLFKCCFCALCLVRSPSCGIFLDQAVRWFTRAALIKTTFSCKKQQKTKGKKTQANQKCPSWANGPSLANVTTLKWSLVFNSVYTLDPTRQLGCRPDPGSVCSAASQRSRL